jgi:alpha-2-macroglobulin-like protein
MQIDAPCSHGVKIRRPCWPRSAQLRHDDVEHQGENTGVVGERHPRMQQRGAADDPLAGAGRRVVRSRALPPLIAAQRSSRDAVEIVHGGGALHRGMKSLPGLLLGAALAVGARSEAAPDGGSSIDGKVASLAPTRLAGAPKLDKAIASYFGTLGTQRSYIQTDKPLYQPGETVWFRTDLRTTKTLVGGPPVGVTVQLLSPRGAVVASKRVLVQNGVARNDFALDAGIEGGEYTLQLVSPSGAIDTRKIIVNTYEAPRLMKTLELLRKAYGPGDPVSAALEIKRTTGEPFGDRTVTAVVAIDDAEVARVPVKTDKEGKALVRFQLPASIARGDGLLTVLVEDAGVTESIQKRIPIALNTLSLAVFPEGGDLVEGVPSRVYFMAKTLIGKPADIEGRVVDDRGRQVATFSSIHDGMGRFELEPAAGSRYHLEVTRPANIVTRIDVPAARPDGCVLRTPGGAAPGHPRDLSSAPDVLRVAAICKTRRQLQIEATLRENRLAGGAFTVEAGRPALIELPIATGQQGAARVTLFSDHQEPLAERLVYVGRGANLKVAITPDRKSYSPRERVKLRVHATDAHGRPVKASVGLAVVDDTVLSFADDKTARILAHVYLEPELGATAADPIEEPNFYFGDKPEAVAAMDALLATRGYRRFEWRQVLPVERSQP